VVIRRLRERKRLRAIRKLIKRFERLEVERLLRTVPHHDWRQFQPWTTVLGSWRLQLARTLAQRAVVAREAIDHTTGVYFPNRAHTTRIALKKFRYIAEIGEQTRVGTLDDSIRELKKSQDILGDLHDRQVLIDKLPKMVAPEHPNISSDHVRTLVEALEAECRELHGEYVSRRSRLLEICAAAEQSFGTQRGATAAAVATGVVALASAAYAWRRRSSATETRNEVAVRIPIDRGIRASG
jgi:CHAD domain-containing protein